ncbi:sensor histidine kinase [Halodesulfovibrio marinisediminis]|uniref:histidine kinase n=2 Tax=Halodesulfovibrio marinisediminis TaxID=458711 RepID=A0A1N6IGK5_9BACT|nr:HAMP domain-containing sensor histidine kinase [Halodesulfovibrio marinisediminis]SIO31131.1 His Kinase A (phospho-acceptor) domain-containing protein [Halodesulfovibrio marinisediminis DSM 17456]
MYISSHNSFRWLAARIFLIGIGPLFILFVVLCSRVVQNFLEDAATPALRYAQALVGSHEMRTTEDMRVKLSMLLPSGQWILQNEVNAITSSNIEDVEEQMRLIETVHNQNGDHTSSIYVPMWPISPNSSVWLHVYVPGAGSVFYGVSIESLLPGATFSFGLCLTLFFSLLVTSIFNSVIFSSFVHEKLAQERVLREKLEQKLIESNRLSAQTRVVAGIAHEINTPLAIMIQEAGWVKELLEDLQEQVDLLNKEPRKALCATFAEMDKSLNVMRKQGKRCADITHGLLRMSRKGAENKAEVDVNAVVQDVGHLLQPKATELGIAFKWQLNAFVPAYASSGHVQQILLNVVNNAIDAVATSESEARKVIVSTFSTKQSVLIRVTDTGAGLSLELKNRIFEPFFTTKAAGQGTGLGLSISHALARRNNGNLSVESSPGKGSSFTLTLPVAEVDFLPAM